MIPQKLNKILDELSQESWIIALSRNSEIYIVGGTVRDAYINKPMKDIDLIVDGLSYTGIKRILQPFGKLDLVGESFSVIKFRPHGHEGEDFDIAVPRTDTKVGDGHKGIAVNTDDVDISEDLKRRDFTINSMAINVLTKELLDPFNGAADLKNGIIRATDESAFAEDPLRILRAVQFAARFDFEIADGTKELMKQNADSIKEITGERLLGEFQKILLKNGSTKVAIDLIEGTDIDLALFDKKMLKIDGDYERLDQLSFYYMLGLMGDVDPIRFYVKRLKGESKMSKDLESLVNVLNGWNNSLDKEDMLLLVMQSFNKSPAIEESVLLSDTIQEMISDMKSGKIPDSMKSLSLNGNEIMSMLNIKGREVGFIIERLIRDALMLRYDWKNKEKSKEYLMSL